MACWVEQKGRYEVAEPCVILGSDNRWIRGDRNPCAAPERGGLAPEREGRVGIEVAKRPVDENLVQQSLRGYGRIREADESKVEVLIAALEHLGTCPFDEADVVQSAGDIHSRRPREFASRDDKVGGRRRGRH